MKEHLSELALHVPRCGVVYGRRCLLFVLAILTVGSLLLTGSIIAHSDNFVRTGTKHEIDRDAQWTGGQVSAPCIDPMASSYNRVEDLFCENLPKFQPLIKNPCMYIPQQKLRPVLTCLPYFYIIGMDKCGTTDFHSKIASHPDVRGNYGSLGKETMFWSWSRYGVFHYENIPKKSYMTDYYDLFKETSSEIQNKVNSSRIITGDATPMDLWDFRHWDLIPQNFNKTEPEILTPHLIRHVYKDRLPKFLIQLREPIERLYSDYVFLKHGKNPETFHEHVLKAMSIIEDCLKTKSLRLCFFDKDIYKKLPTRIHLGCYSVYIQEWLAVFPRSSLHVTRTEDFHDDMTANIESVFSFLDLDPLPEQRLAQIVNQSRKHVTKSKKGKVLPQTFQLLYDFYLPCLKQTASLLNDRRYLWEDVYDRHEANTHTRLTAG